MPRPRPDRHRLYERAVQSPEAEIDFVDRVFRRLRRRTPFRLREDFCGTASTACAWVQRRPLNTALGLDLHAPTLRWARDNNFSALDPSARRRIRLLRRTVLSPGPTARRM